MSHFKIKSAYARITTNDHFRKETILLMLQEQIKNERRQADKPKRQRLFLAAASTLLVLAGVILVWQMIVGNIAFQPLSTSRSILPAITNPVDTQTATIETSENHPTGSEQKIVVVSDAYPDSLVDIRRPEQGEVIISPTVQPALNDPNNTGKYFYVHLYIIPAEQYAHDAKNYIYNGRTIAEWHVLVDLSKGAYPYSEYNGDHGGKVTLEEWKQKQEEAKTLTAQENLDAATEQYNAAVRPMIKAAQAASEQSEWTRLAQLGYDVTLSQTWSYINASDKQFYTILTGLLSQKQIIEFPANSSFGCLIDWVHNGDGIVTWDAGK